jgi:hypothetical protein
VPKNAKAINMYKSGMTPGSKFNFGIFYQDKQVLSVKETDFAKNPKIT